MQTGYFGFVLDTGYTLVLDGDPVDQAVHGGDFWQTDYDPATRRWSQTFTILVSSGKPHSLKFISTP